MILLSDPSLKKPIGDWVSNIIFENSEIGFTGKYNAIGVFDGTALVAGTIYHNWNPAYETICMSIASCTPRWATRRIIEGLLRYPFLELGVQRITVTAKATNFASLRLIEGVGFTREARLERAAGRNDDIVVLRLFIEEFLAGKFYREDDKNGIFQTGLARAS